MTLPRWWDNRFMLGLVLTSLVLAGIVHLLSFVPAGVPITLHWVFLFSYLAFALIRFWQIRRPDSSLPPSPPELPGSWWQRLRAEFTTGPLWLRLLNIGYRLTETYAVLTIVLGLADPGAPNFLLRVITLTSASQYLYWLRTYLTTRPAPGAGRVPL